MKVEVKEKITISPKQPIDIINCNEEQQRECDLEEANTQSSNKVKENKETTTTFNDSTDLVLSHKETAENNNNIKSKQLDNKNNLPASLPLPDNVEVNQKLENFNETTKTTVTVTEEAVEVPISNNSNDEEDRDETDKGRISPKDEIMMNKEKIEQDSGKSTSPSDVPSCTNSAVNEKAQIEIGNDRQNNSAVADESNEMNGASNIDNAPDAHMKQPVESLVGVKKQYNREQLMQLRQVEASRIDRDELKKTSIYSKSNLMPSFAYNHNKNVQSMFGGSRTSVGGNGNYQNYVKSNAMTAREDSNPRNSGKSMIHLNLSLSEEVKLTEAENAWRPRAWTKGSDSDVDPEKLAEREKEELVRRVRGILNKLTPEKFDPLVEEVIKLKIDTVEKMKAVMILVFEKAIEEPNFSVSYAKLCHRLINEVKTSETRTQSGTKINLANSFRNELLGKAQQEFTQNVTKSTAKEEKLKTIIDKINACEDENEKIELKALLEEEERKIRRRCGGTVRFIGELFKINLLTGNIINCCIDSLIKEPNNEDMLECLCKLVTTVGCKFEQTNNVKDGGTYSLDNVIKRMRAIASKSENSQISSRIRFMLLDVIDLREKKWMSTRNEAPKTMEQIEKEVNIEQLSNSYKCMNAASGGGNSSKRDGRDCSIDRRNYGGRHSQRGETGSLKRQQQGGNHNNVGSHNSQSTQNPTDDDTWQIKTGKGNRSVVVDSSKLIGMALDINNKKMGGVSLFTWNNTASSQPTSTPSNSFASLSVDSKKSVDMVQNRDHSGSRNKTSYNKGSMKRDRYDHDRSGLNNRSTQGTRDYTSRGNHGGISRAMSLNMQKSSSHSAKYQQPMSSSPLSRMTLPKKPGMTVGSSGNFTSTASFKNDSQKQQQDQERVSTVESELSQPIAKPIAIFVELSDSDLKLVKTIIIDMMESSVPPNCIDMTTVSCIKEIKENQLCGMLYYILTDYLHLANVGPSCRRHLANIIAYLIETNFISIEHLKVAYKNFFELASDLMFDIPELWLYVFEFIGPLIVKKLITVQDLWHSQVSENQLPDFSQKFLKTLLQYCTREVGPNFTRNLWKTNQMKWTSFMSENDVAKFIQTNKFEYVENENMQPDVICSKESKTDMNKRVGERIEQLLKSDADANDIIDYINGNIIDIDATFIEQLTTILNKCAIKHHSKSYNLASSCYQQLCIPVLLHYLKYKEDLELACLSAIQSLDCKLGRPKGLLEAIFAELKQAKVISEKTFSTFNDTAGKQNSN